MKHVGKKLLALLLVLSMLSGMSFNNVTIASAEETTAACITSHLTKAWSRVCE